MATAKMETAAQRYRRRRADRQANQPLTEVVCPTCETPWQCKREKLDFWISSGILPSQLAVTFVNLQKAGKATEKDLLASLESTQLLQSIEFMSKVVRHTAVSPRIVENPKEDADEIGYDEVDGCCYATLRDWQMKGGDEAARLGNFPKE